MAKKSLENSLRMSSFVLDLIPALCWNISVHTCLTEAHFSTKKKQNWGKEQNLRGVWGKNAAGMEKRHK